VRFRFIRRHAGQFRVSLMCKVLQVSRPGYYAWCRREPSRQALANQALLVRLRQLFKQHRGRYGYRRVYEAVRKDVPCGIHRVARLMRQDGLKVVPRKGYRQTTQSNYKRPVVPNILGREFTAAAPNLTWLSDITYVPTGQRWLYLAIVLDLYARRVVGWSMSDRLTDQLTCDALKMAVKSRRPAPALLHHSDQGVQYASLDYRSLLLENKSAISMSRRGDAYDNAPMESFFATLKKELIHRQQYQTRREARVSIFEYIAGYYNPVCLHSAIGYHSPVAYEALFVSP
jgi:transposase InsO family protein